MEGPTLVLAAEQLAPFKNKMVLAVAGNTKIGKELFLQKKALDIFSWGKHLVFQFDTFAMRIHFLLFGTYEATINGQQVTGDYKRTRESRLTLTFPNGEFKMFNGSIKILGTDNAKDTYDFSIDIMSDQWNATKAYKHMRRHTTEEIADVLLDQTVFGGVGNIIKNEVLSMTHINPKTRVSTLTAKQLKRVIKTTKIFSHQFYTWRKDFVLRKHLIIHRKSVCPFCGKKVVREKMGKRTRWSYYCPYDQPLQ